MTTAMQVWSLSADINRMPGTRKVFVEAHVGEGEPVYLVAYDTRVNEFGNLVIRARKVEEPK